MSYLFTVQVDKTNTPVIVLNENCVKLCPPLATLTKEEILYIVLSTDYRSPYHQFPDMDRKRKARYHVWGDKKLKAEPYDSKRIQVASEYYTSLQYDHRRELLSAYKKKLQLMQSDIMMEDGSKDKKLEVLIKNMNLLKKEIHELELEIESNDDFKTYIQGGETLSLIEILQKNNTNFRNFRKPTYEWNHDNNS